MPGLAIGVVTDIKEPGTAERGWVRLKFPWLDDAYVTDWVRTVQWGGVGGGGVFSPEVNDEVLVGFEQGSLDRPYVLGGLYNGVDKPSAARRAAGRPHQRQGQPPLAGVARRQPAGAARRAEAGPSGVRLATGDKQLEVLLDAATHRIELTLAGCGTAGDQLDPLRRAASPSTPGAASWSCVAGTCRSPARPVSRVDGGAQAVLRGRLIRIN